MEEKSIFGEKGSKFPKLVHEFNEKAMPCVGEGKKTAYILMAGELTDRGLLVSSAIDGDPVTAAGTLCSLMRRSSGLVEIVEKAVELYCKVSKKEGGKDEAGD